MYAFLANIGWIFNVLSALFVKGVQTGPTGVPELKFNLFPAAAESCLYTCSGSSYQCMGDMPIKQTWTQCLCDTQQSVFVQCVAKCTPQDASTAVFLLLRETCSDANTAIAMSLSEFVGISKSSADAERVKRAAEEPGLSAVLGPFMVIIGLGILGMLLAWLWTHKQKEQQKEEQVRVARERVVELDDLSAQRHEHRSQRARQDARQLARQQERQQEQQPQEQQQEQQQQGQQQEQEQS